jgi:osmotically-inducible protein OsmY
VVPKGKLTINAEGGTVFLRGQVESQELIDDLTESVGKIAGVREVLSLLHLPGTPAPHHG